MSSEQIPESGGTAAVQAHYDDSSLAIHKARTLFPRPHRLVTIFSVSSHCKRGYTPQPGEDISLTRAEEDRRYCDAERMSHHALGFEDRPELINGNEQALAMLLSSVRQRLSDLLLKLGCEFVVVPWPFGPRRHVHHDVVWQAAAEALADLERPTLIGADDIPYSRRRPLTAPFDWGGVQYIPHVVPLSNRELSRKLAAIRTYESQFKKEFLGAVLEPAPGDPGPTETLWVPRGLRIAGLKDQGGAASPAIPGWPPGH